MLSLSELHVAVITVSDRCAHGHMLDTSGPAVIETIQSFFKDRASAPADSAPACTDSDDVRGHRGPHQPQAALHDCQRVFYRSYLTTDDISAVQALIRSLTSAAPNSLGPLPQLIITTGGTGFSPRDITPEATRPLLDKEAPGLVHKMLNSSLPLCSSAWLSRAVAGVRGGAVIVTLPGSTKAIGECLQPLLRSGLLHAVELASQPAPGSPQSHGCVLAGDKLPPSAVAGRSRVSPYPMVPMHEALRIIAEQADRVLSRGGPSLTCVPLAGALHRVLAEPLHTTFPHPPFRASIKDGYAVLAEDGTGVFEVVGESPAGADASAAATLRRGQAWRVNTGGMVPAGADAVVQVEDTELVEVRASDGAEHRVRICVAATPGQDIRPVGVDMPADTEVLPAGTFITPAEVAVAAAIGATSLRVFTKPVVAVFSTGDELISAEAYAKDGAAPDGSQHLLPQGKIIDSNKAMLLAALRDTRYAEVGAVQDIGVVHDSLTSTKAKIKEALLSADVVLSTGGVSMGDVDHVKRALLELGATLHFGRVNMKPGKPTTFATFDSEGKFFFGLPGNPVSALVCLQLFVVPLLRRLARLPERYWADPVVPAQVEDERFNLDRERPEYRRCTLTRRATEGGVVSYCARSCGGQASSRLLSLVQANGLMMLPCEKGGVRARGDIVDVLVIGNLL